MEIINIGTNDSDQRIDSFLKKLMPAAPQSLIYKYLRTNKIKLNGSKPKPDTRISEGDIIKFFGDSSLISKKSFAPSATPRLNIIFEDENIIMIDKPRMTACQPDNKHRSETLIDSVKSYLYSKGEYLPQNENSFSPALCNRIDFNTSGLCIAAKNAEALRIINEKIKKREVLRFYICITSGIPSPPEGTIKNRILKNTADNKSFISEKGKPAETHYKVLKEKNGCALVETEIITGRTHQIRLHMSSIGCPIIADPKYGNGGSGQKLTAHKIVFAFKSDAGKMNYLKNREFFASPDFNL